MKLILSILLILSASFTPFAKAGPIIVGNAAGLAEFQYVYAWKNISDFVKVCGSNPQCKLSPTSAERVLSIASKAHPELIFASGAQSPQFFLKLDGKLLAFGTRPTAQAQVYINTDLLYEKPLDDSSSLAKYIEVLSAALAYQSGETLQESLQMGATIGRYWEAQIQSSSFTSAKGDEIQLNVLQKSLPHVVLFDSQKAYFLNTRIENALTKLLGETNEPSLSSFKSPYWVQGKNGQIILIAQIDFTGPFQQGQAEIAISFHLKENQGASTVAPDFAIEFFNLELR